MTKINLLLTLIVSTLVFSSIIIIEESRQYNEDNEELVLRPSTAVTLSYGEYAGSHRECCEDDNVDWEFEGNNPYVGIKVRAMSAMDYEKMVDGKAYSYFELSDGSYYDDHGSWDPPTDDDWHIVFMNLDPDMENTYLIYEVSFEIYEPPTSDPDDNNRELLLFLTYGFLFVILPILFCIGLPIFLIRRKKKKKDAAKFAPSAYTATQPPIVPQGSQVIQQRPTISQFCVNCGAPMEGGGEYCPNCGKKY